MDVRTADFGREQSAPINWTMILTIAAVPEAIGRQRGHVGVSKLPGEREIIFFGTKTVFSGNKLRVEI